MVSRSIATVAILTVLPFAIAFATIALAVNRATDVEEQVRTAQNERARVLRLQLDQETGVRGYIATQNRAFLQPYWSAQQPFRTALAALRASVVRLAPDVVSSVDDQQDVHQLWVDSVARPLIRDPRNHAAKSLQIEGKRLIDRFRDDNEVIARALHDAARQSDTFARYLVYAIIAIGLALGTGLLFFVLRIGDRQRLLAGELKEANAALNAAASAKDNFLAGMSHELRTPLNAVIGFTGTLLMKLPGPLNDEQEDQLRIVQTSARHLLSLINDILDVAKIRSGKIEVHSELLDVYGVVQEVASTLRGLAEQKGLLFELKTGTGSLVATTDRRMLQQILTNLVSNAIKYTEIGFVRIEANESTQDNRQWIEIAVVDSGVGIEDEDQAKIFDAFERIDNTATRRTTGSGLGLNLSHRFATIMGGRLTVTSEAGVGSRFTVSFPQQAELPTTSTPRGPKPEGRATAAP